jgi:hypothetical protein
MPIVHLFLGFLFLQAPKPASIAGLAANAATGSPVRKARLTLQSIDHHYAAVSDASGRFAVAEVAPGTYNIRTECDGFQVTAQSLKIAEDQHITDLAIRLVPLGVIAGKVVDENGELLSQISVEAQVDTFGPNGRKRLPGGIATTDDRGEYRIFDLPPGRYFVMAANPRSYSLLGGHVHADAVEMAYVSTSFPNVTDASQASVQVLAPGAELDGIDLHMHKQRVFHVRGHVQLPPGQRGAVDVVPCGGGSGIGINTAILKDGAFDAAGLIQGNWCLMVNQVVDNTHAFYASQSVTIAEHDVNNVNLALTPATVIRGQILVDGAAPAKLPHMPIRLDPVEQPGRGAGTAASEDGSFVLENVAPAQYRLMNLNLSGMYLKAIRLNGQDVANGIIQVTQGGAQMTLLFSTDSGEAGGTVEGGGNFVSAESASSLTSMPAISGVTPEGKFQFRNLPPGEYKMLAWETTNFGLLQYAEFRKLFDSRAVTLTVHAKGQEAVQLKVVTAAEIEAALARLQ